MSFSSNATVSRLDTGVDILCQLHNLHVASVADCCCRTVLFSTVVRMCRCAWCVYVCLCMCACAHVQARGHGVRGVYVGLGQFGGILSKESTTEHAILPALEPCNKLSFLTPQYSLGLCRKGSMGLLTAPVPGTQ